MISRSVLLLCILFSIFYSVHASCGNYTSCGTCVGTSLSPANHHCQWCSDIGECIGENEETNCPGARSQCSESYYTIIFIVVITALGCLCFGTCCLRKIHLTDEDGNFLSPMLLVSAAFRSKAVAETEEFEWMCIICGFDNKSNADYCTMCGTSHQFSSDYKTEKMTLRKQRRSKKNKEKDIKIPHEAQISSSSFQSGEVLAALSQHQRAEIFNYRRLNQLTLRQKSARRRRMWQRVYDEETDEIKWVRTPVAETKVGTSLFGYSPSHSFDDTMSRVTSYGDGEDHGQYAAIRESLLPRHGGSFRGSQSTIIPTANQRKQRDSFDDVVCSSSPGYTSVFGTEGELQWEQVETGNAAQTNIIAPLRSNPSGSSHRVMASPMVTSRLDLSFNDLEAAAVLPYKQKQQWFVKHLATLQRPWNEGYVRFEVNKSSLLSDSCKCMLQLRKADLHKWMRIQFTGSSGVDAGGLEREWFALVVAELLDPKNGLFISSSASDSTPGTGVDSEGGEADLGQGERESDGLLSPRASGVERVSNMSATGAGAGGSSGGSFHINPLSAQFNPDHLEYFQFAGRFFGKGILEQQTINAPLSLPLRKQLLSLPITFSDLEFVDDELYRNLRWLQTHEQVDALDLDFTVTYTYTPSHQVTSTPKPNIHPPKAFVSPGFRRESSMVPRSRAGAGATTFTASARNSAGLGIAAADSTSPTFNPSSYTSPELIRTSSSTGLNSVTGSMKKVSFSKELKPDGANIMVTDQNKGEYLQLKLRDRMLDSIKPQLEHFLRGFYEVIPGDLLSVFDYQELDLLMCGLHEIDINDWKANTEYLGEYHAAGAKHRVIKWFWSVMESFDNEERVRLLQFTTGCSRLPPQGFKSLQSNNGTYRKFNIQSIEKGEYAYPRAHTCFNKLDLPLYESKAELEAYLSVVVNMEATGFTMD